MSEGSLEAPERHPIPWQDPDFYDEQKLDNELRRQFDICHGCRRCHNLCDSFPRLFDLIDEAESMELDTVDSKDFKSVVDACTLCDMCFLTKCPYVPPHEFNLDLPHLMLRYRAVEHKKGQTGLVTKQIAKTDRNGKLAGAVAPISNWASRIGNGLTRPAMEAVTGIDKHAALPKFYGKTLTARAASVVPKRDVCAPAAARKAVVYSTCFVNYNDPAMGEDALEVLERNGVEAELLHPMCCGMPKLEHGDIEGVAEAARTVAAEFMPWIEKGYDVVALTPSCSLMLKFEWPLILPDDEDVRQLSQATRDISEYLVDISKNEGLADGMSALDGSVTVHLACHSRAQNMGQKGAEMLRFIPDTAVTVIERCSGHGGSLGIMKDTFEVGLKVGKPVARQAAKAANPHVVSECPLARDHILQGIERLGDKVDGVSSAQHPVQLLAKAYGL